MTVDDTLTAGQVGLARRSPAVVMTSSTPSRNKILVCKTIWSVTDQVHGTIDLSMLMIMCVPVHACNLPACRCLPACLPALMLHRCLVRWAGVRARAACGLRRVSCTVYNFL